MPIDNQYTSKQRSSNYRNPVVEQQFQPLPIPFSTRTDIQWISQHVPTSQFTGATPNAAQGTPGGATGPTQGGRWMFGGNVIIESIAFETIGGLEPVARGAGSGIFVFRKNSKTPQLIVTLANTDQYVMLTDNIHLPQGDILKIITLGATLPMIGRIVVSRDRRHQGGI